MMAERKRKIKKKTSDSKKKIKKAISNEIDISDSFFSDDFVLEKSEDDRKVEIETDKFQSLPVNINPKGRNKKDVFTMKCQYPDCFYKSLDLDAELYFFKTAKSDNGYYPICRDCLGRIAKNGDKEEIFKILKDMGIPYVDSVWEDCVKSGGKNLFLNYVKQMTSELYKDLPEKSDEELEEIKKRNERKERIVIIDDSSQKKENSNLSAKNKKKKQHSLRDLKNYWGVENEEELTLMQDLFDSATENIQNLDSNREELIKVAIMYRAKEILSLRKGNVDNIKKWSDLASKAYMNAKLNATQVDEDVLKGVSSFSEMSKLMESTYDVIHILPRFMYQPNDAVDFILWQYINYVRGLQGKDDCRYEDIWNFYDLKKKQYIESTGDPYKIFETDPTNMNRSLIQKFLEDTYDKEN